MPQAKTGSIRGEKDNEGSRNGFVLVTGRSNVPLAEKIAKILKKDLHKAVSVFSDGEIRVKIPPNLRRRHIFILQPTCVPVNDSIMELIFMIDAAKRSSAQEITAVIPYFGYSRQDRKEMPHVPISSSVIAGIVEAAGANRIVTVDIHSEQQQGFVKVPWDNLYGSYTFIPHIKKRHLKDLIVAAPDKGGMTRATGYAKLLDATGIAIVYKERDVQVNNKSEALEMIGDVKGKNVVLVDDMIDTAGTIVNAANYIKERGAKSILVCSTHGVFSGPALDRIRSSAIDEVIVTDTMPIIVDKKDRKITVVSVAPLLAEAIKRIQTGESISRDLIL